MVNNNKILYENWVKNQKEEDKVFVFDNGILMVFFERLLNFKLDDNLIGMFTFKNKYTVADAEVVIDGIKTLQVKSGKKTLEAGDFTFALYKGEEKISELLMLNKVDFKEQYSFKDCKYKGNLKFDFYLPSLNVCIEYDGEAHFEPVNFGGKSEEELKAIFKEGLKRDEIKNEYCKKNNIKLIRIPYWEFENIETIIKNILNN